MILPNIIAMECSSIQFENPILAKVPDILSNIPPSDVNDILSDILFVKRIAYHTPSCEYFYENGGFNVYKC